MAPSSSICVSFFTDFDENVIATGNDRQWRNKRIDRAVMRQKHRKLAKVKERAYATSLDDIICDSDNDDDDAPCPNKVVSDLDVMDQVELKLKDGLSIVDPLPELDKVSKDKLINHMLHLVSRVCACDNKIAKLENSCDGLLVENEKMKRDVYLGDKQLEIRRRLLDELHIDYDALKSENYLLKSNGSMPCNSCIALSDDLDKARDVLLY